MLYLLESDTRNVKWNGIPLHEATSAIIKEQMNGDFILTVRYPITDSEIYQLFREDMLIKAPAPVIGPQLFRIKKPVENDDHLEITAYHITDDVMQRSINPLSVNKQSCWQALSQLVQVAKSPINDFSFTSDITDRRTINTKEVETLYSVLMDGAHSIVGTWEGELVRDNFAISIKRNRGEDRGVIISTHKNLKSYQRTKNSQNVVTRIHAKSTFKAEGAKEDTTIAITVDSPLIGAYPYINERSYTNNNIQTVEELTKWASAKFTNEHIDKATDAIKIEAYELDGQTVHMGDTVNLKSYKHNVDVYKKAIAYEYDCLANNGQGAYLTITFDDKVKSGGNGGGVSAVANAILDKQETQFDIMLERAIANADRAFDAEFAKREKAITDGIELAKAKAEEVKQELSDTINQRFDSFDNGPLKEAKRKAEEALRNAGASSLLAQESKQIGLDSVARLEAFKSQTTSAQTAFSGDLDALKQTIANDIRPKQAQAESEIAKQVEALIQTKKELAGVKSAQATYEETTTRRLAELTNLANGKASKSELTQTAEELVSKLASVQAGSSRNYFRNSRSRTFTTGDQATYDYRTFIVPDFWKNNDRFKRDYVRLSFDVTFPVALTSDTQANVHFSAHPWYGYKLMFKGGTTERQHFEFTIDLSSSSEIYQTNNVFIRFGTNFGFPAGLQVVIENATLSVGNYFPAYQPAYEDQEDRVSTVESNFRQRADALDAGVSRLTEGLRIKADISSLNVTAENIRQSVKSLETSTQNKLDQKLSMAEFEVQAGSIRQEILNATKDKADKTLVVAEAGKLRTELSTVQDYINKDGQRKEELQRYSREESARQVNAVRELIARDYVGKSTHQEDVRGIERRFEAITNPQNGTIATQIANYKQSVDGRFAGIISQVATKANQTDFQRVQETSKLYERIIGSNENDISNKVARMALTNQLFQVEVGKYANVGGPNMLRNSRADDGLKYWTEADGRLGFTAHQFYFNGQKKMFELRPGALVKSPRFIVKRSTDYILNILAFDNNSKYLKIYFCKRKKGSISDFEEKQLIYDGKPMRTDGPIFDGSRAIKKSFQFNVGDFDDGYLQFEYERNNPNKWGGLFMTELDFYEGSNDRLWQPAPEDAVADANAKLEATQTKMTQLAGSWAVQNINNAGDLISGINLGADGRNRFIGKTFHITGETLIDNAVIKSAMIDKLKTANFEAGSVTTTILDAEAVTAEKLKVDNALIRKITANEAFIDQLTSKQIFATKVESVVSSSTFLEAYQGRIGGFTLGQFDQGGGRWISGVNQFSVGMGNGAGYGVRTAFWANWGNNWNYAGPKAWNVNTDGKMYCRNEVGFYDQVDFSNSSRANFYGNTTFSRSPVFSNGIELGEKDVFGDGWNPKGGRNAVVWWNQVGSGSVKYWMDQKSDRRLKENITDTAVKALNKINRLRMVAFDFIESKKHEEIGLIAQEVETIVPRIVSRDPENPDGYLHIDYTALVPYLIKAIQELNQKIEKMEKTIA